MPDAGATPLDAPDQKARSSALEHGVAVNCRPTGPPPPGPACPGRPSTPRRRAVPVVLVSLEIGQQGGQRPSPSPGNSRSCSVAWSGSGSDAAGASHSWMPRMEAPGMERRSLAVGPAPEVVPASSTVPVLGWSATRTTCQAVARSGILDQGRNSRWTSRPCSIARSHSPANAAAASSSDQEPPKTSTVLIQRVSTVSARRRAPTRRNRRSAPDPARGGCARRMRPGATTKRGRPRPPPSRGRPGTGGCPGRRVPRRGPPGSRAPQRDAREAPGLGGGQPLPE